MPKWLARLVSSLGGSGAAVDPEILSLVRAGRKIDAIRRYLSITGAGLKEAKVYIERL